MGIRIQKGDLLSAEADALVNTVNCVGVMGKGIALQFKKKWPSAFKDYKKVCDKKQLRPGMMHVHDLGQLAGKPYYIIHFPTKDHWRGKSKVSYLEDGLKELVKTITVLGINSIAIPPLGCGNGGLEWTLVESLIRDAFKPIESSVDVLLYAPEGAPEARNIAVRTTSPNMTIGRAILIKLLALYRQLEYSLSKIEVQKLCYFAQEAGQPLRLNYVKHQYGPYADNLRHVLNRMDGHFIQGVGDHASSETQLTLLEGAIEQADAFLKTDAEAHARLIRVQNLIEGFETPLGMELLATVHWVACKDLQSEDPKAVLNGVQHWSLDHPDWSRRKQTLMPQALVETALNHLKNQGWLKNP